MCQSQLSPGNLRLLAVAIGTYDHFGQLGEAVGVTSKLIELFTRSGFAHDYPELVGERVIVKTIDDTIKIWFPERNKNNQLLVYWTGHGLRSNISGHLLAATDTPANPLSYQAIEPKLLIELLVRSSAQVGLLIIDACFSGEAGLIADESMADLRRKVIPPQQIVGKRVGVLTSAHPSRTITSPVFGAALVKVLGDPDIGSVSWGRRDAKINLRHLAEALSKEIGERSEVHIDWWAWEAKSSGWASDDGAEWLPNPTWIGQIPDEVVELQRTLFGLSEAAGHWDLSHRGLEVGSLGWSFVGREVALTTIVKWLESDRNGMLVVTGPPGSGKSAVVGRLVTLSVEAYLARAKSAGVLADVPDTTLPTVGVINAAVHARDKTLLDVIIRLVDAFGLMIEKTWDTKYVRTATEALESHLYGLGLNGCLSTIVIDSLDEARPNHRRSIAQLCHKLGEVPGVRVLVGVRYSVQGELVPRETDRHALLKQMWPDSIIVDLGDDPNTHKDLARYIDARLATKHQDEEQRQTLAAGIATRAVSGGGYFLYARIMARTLIESETLPGPEELPREATEAFATDLLTRFGHDRDRFDDFLGALGWAYGAGFPKTVWAQVASAISSMGAVYEIADVNEILRRAGSHVIESEEDHESVYRLGHELLSEYYRNQKKGDDVETRIALAICEGADFGGGWDSATPYAVRYVLEYVLNRQTDGLKWLDITERIVGLCTNPVWLKRAVLLIGVGSVIDLLDRVCQLTETEDLKVLARVLRRSRVAISRDVNQLVAQLHARLAGTNVHSLRELINKLHTLAPAIWLRSRGKLLGWMADLETSYTVIGTVRSLAFGEVDGTTILGMAVDDNVILWDPRKGVDEERVIHNPGGRVTGLSIEYLAGEPVLVIAAGYDRNVVIRNFWTGEQTGPTYTGCDFVNSVTVGLVRGRHMVVAVGNSQLWMWDRQSGTRVDDDFMELFRKNFPRIVGQARAQQSSSITNVLTLNGRVILTLLRSDRTGFCVTLIDADLARPIWPGHWSPYEPTVIATSILPRGPVTAAIFATKRPRLSLGAWSPASTDKKQREVGWGLRGVMEGAVRALSVGEVDDRVVVAYAPNFDGSGFVTLVEVDPTLESVQEDFEFPPSDPSAMNLWNLDIWSVILGYSPAVRVLASCPQLCVLNVRSGSAWGTHEDRQPTPEVVSHFLSGNCSRDVAISAKPVESIFSTLNADEAMPISVGKVHVIKNILSSFEPVRLRKANPESWPATTVSRGMLDGRAVLVCGSYQGVIWVWDLEKENVLAGPFADIPDEIEFMAHTNMAGISVTTDVAIGEVDGDYVVVAAVSGRVKLYDVNTGASLPEPAVRTSIVVAVAMGKFDGRSILVTGSRGGVLAVWEVKTGKRITGVTLDSEINGVWVVNGADAIAARSRGRLFVFDLVQNDIA
jgi:WD40 repeat protein